MIFNVDKCQVLQTSLRNIFTFSYTLYNHFLENVNEAKYMGIVINSKLNFNKHIDSVCKKANSALAFLKRNLSSCKCEMKSDAYLMYVRPILEYAACSWAPHTKCNIDKLESVQRRAARFVNGDYRYTSSVTEMINTLRWNSLHGRRDTLRLQMMYKITHHIIDLKLPNYINYNPGITRGHDYKLTVPFTRIDPYKFSFFPATIALLNKLPTEIVNATSTDSFTYLLNIN